jgi:metal-responsive CopG/Arc/MetJ family transcriptional regulator
MKSEKGIRRVVWLSKELDARIEELRQKIGYSRSGIYRYILTRYLEKIGLWQSVTKGEKFGGIAPRNKKRKDRERRKSNDSLL